MGKSAKKSASKADAAAVVVTPSKPLTKGKRGAEDVVDKKVVSSKKQKVELKSEIKPEKKVPKKKVESSSDDDSSSESEQLPKAKAPPAKNGKVGSDSDSDSSGLEEASAPKKTPATAAKNGHAATKKKDESSDDSSDETSSDEDVPAAKKAPVAAPKKAPAAASKKESSSDDSDSDDSSDEEVPAKKAPVTAPVSATKKKEESSSDDSSDETSSDEDVAAAKKAPAAPAKKGAVAAKKKAESSSSDESSDEEATPAKTAPKAAAKKDESSDESESEDDSSDEEETPKAAPVKKAATNAKKAAADGSDDDSSEESEDEDSSEEEDEKPAKIAKKNDGDVKMTDAEKTPSTPKPAQSTGGSKTLFVGNLSFNVDQAAVEEFFQSAGEVVDVRFALKDGEFRGFGHVEFATEEAAQKALRELNGEQLLNREVRLDLARERGAYTPFSGGRETQSFQRGGEGQTAFIRGFDKNNSEDQIRSSLEEHFSSCGEITRVSIPKDPEGGVKGIAYIDFKESDAFAKALELNGSELEGGSLYVDAAKPRDNNNGERRDSGGRFSGNRGGRFGDGGRGRGRFGDSGGRGRGRFGDSGGRGRGRFGNNRPSMATPGTGKKTKFDDE